MALISGFWRSFADTLHRTGCSRCSLPGRPAERIFCPRISRDFAIQRMQAGRAFSISSGATTLARIAECGQAATQWLQSEYTALPSRWGSLGDVAFLPAGGAHGPASGGRAETGSASPSPASIAAVTVLTKSGAAFGDHRRAFGLLAFTGWSGTSASDSMGLWPVLAGVALHQLLTLPL